MKLNRTMLALPLAAAAITFPPANLCAERSVVLDLTAGGDDSGVILGAIFTRNNVQPTGTGVFDPFLTMQPAVGQLIEQGYNTSAGGTRPLPLDDLRVHWNRDIRVSDLAPVTLDGNQYYVFRLDADEPGQANIKKYLSIDNIRVYTSPIGGQTTTDVDELGRLRYGMNSLEDPLNVNGNWVKIDATLTAGAGHVNSGGGPGDLTVYLPASYFDGASPTDYVYFYNLNGAHFATEPGTGAEGGAEVWRAFTRPRTVTVVINDVPNGRPGILVKDAPNGYDIYTGENVADPADEDGALITLFGVDNYFTSPTPPLPDWAGRFVVPQAPVWFRTAVDIVWVEHDFDNFGNGDLRVGFNSAFSGTYYFTPDLIGEENLGLATDQWVQVYANNVLEVLFNPHTYRLRQ